MDHASRRSKSAHHIALLPLGQKLVCHPEESFIHSARQAPAKLEEQLLQEKIRHEVKAIKFSREELFQFSARACMHDQVRIHGTLAQQTKIVVRQNRFAAKANGSILSHDQHP